MLGGTDVMGLGRVRTACHDLDPGGPAVHWRGKFQRVGMYVCCKGLELGSLAREAPPMGCRHNSRCSLAPDMTGKDDVFAGCQAGAQVSVCLVCMPPMEQISRKQACHWML